eukprot:1155033-Pelagomonas_calceolata.AAC.4
MEMKKTSASAHSHPRNDNPGQYWITGFGDNPVRTTSQCSESNRAHALLLFLATTLISNNPYQRNEAVHA